MCHGEGQGWGWGRLAWGAGPTGSVVLEEREQVLAAVRGQVRRAQVGQQLIRVGQFRQQLKIKQTPQTHFAPVVALALCPARSRAVPPSDTGLAPEPEPALGSSCRGSCD